MNMEQRVRRAADRMSSRESVMPYKHEFCKTRKCEEVPAVQGYCFVHWRKSKEK